MFIHIYFKNRNKKDSGLQCGSYLSRSLEDDGVLRQFLASNPQTGQQAGDCHRGCALDVIVESAVPVNENKFLLL